MQALVKPVQLYWQEFSSGKAHSAESLALMHAEPQAEAIAERIQKKRLRGEPLSRLERHLEKNSSGLRRALCGPTLGQTFKEAARHSIKPLLLLALFTGASRGYVLQDSAFQPQRIVVSPGFRKIVSNLVTEAHASAAVTSHNAVLADISEAPVPEPPLPGPLVFSPPTAQTSGSLRTQELNSALEIATLEKLQEQTNLLKFIAGVIIVFRPNIENAGEIARHIVTISSDNGLDPLFIASVISSESGFRPGAKSPVGALGLMQLRPSTAKEVLNKMTKLGKANEIRQYLQNPEINIRLGIQYLKELENQYRGNRFLALAAYNWGPGNVSKARRKGQKIPGSVQHYATSILERTERWQAHFQGAATAAEKLSEEPLNVGLLAQNVSGGRS